MLKMITNKKGSVSIEASIIFALLTIILVSVADIGNALVMKNRLERMSYSYLSLIRTNDLNTTNLNKLQKQVIDMIFKSAENEIKNYLPKGVELGMSIERVTFKKEINPSIDTHDSFTYGKECEIPDFPTKLAAKISTNSFLPLNRVILCIKSNSILSSNLININAESIGVSK